MRSHRLSAILLTWLIACFWIYTLIPETGAIESKAQVDINKASVDELVTLPKIGPKIAEQIVKYRQEHGPFRTIEDLKAIKGIGDKTIEALRPMITVTPK